MAPKKRVKTTEEVELENDSDHSEAPTKSPSKSKSKSSKSNIGSSNSAFDKSQSSLKSFFSPSNGSEPTTPAIISPIKKKRKIESVEKDEGLEWAIQESLKMAAEQRSTGASSSNRSQSKQPLFLGDQDEEEEEDGYGSGNEKDEEEEALSDFEMQEVAKTNQVIEISDDDEEEDEITFIGSKGKQKVKSRGKGKEDSGYGGSDRTSTSTASPPVQEVSDTISCPSCSKEISTKDAQDHVNACLDKMVNGGGGGGSNHPSKQAELYSKIKNQNLLNRRKFKSPHQLDEKASIKKEDSSKACSPSDPSIPMNPLTSLLKSTTNQGLSSSKPSAPNAFTKLMSSRHNKEWESSDYLNASKKAKGKNKASYFGNGSDRKVPFYKILEGMPICVDGFRFGNIEACEAFFLTHFHR